MSRKARSRPRGATEKPNMNGNQKMIPNGTETRALPAAGVIGKQALFMGLGLTLVAILMCVTLSPERTQWVWGKTRPTETAIPAETTSLPPPPPPPQVSDQTLDLTFNEIHAWSTTFTCQQDHFIDEVTYTFLPGEPSVFQPDQKDANEHSNRHMVEKLKELTIMHEARHHPETRHHHPETRHHHPETHTDYLPSDQPADAATSDTLTSFDRQNHKDNSIDVDSASQDEKSDNKAHLPPGFEPLGNFTLTLGDALFTWYQQHYREDIGVKFKPRGNHDNFLTWEIQPTRSYKVGRFPRSYGPCPPLVYCLGHQACLFRFTNEFCLQDPIPGYRKILQLTLRCRHDSGYAGEYSIFKETLSDILHASPTTMTPSLKGFPYDDSMTRKYIKNGDVMSYVTGGEERLDNWPRNAMFIAYRSLVEQGIRDYANTALLPLEIDENMVFHTSCPSPSQAYDFGFRGQCDRVPPPPAVVSDMMWAILGRSPVEECRRELLEVFCAYQLNPNGLCVPRTMVDFDRDSNETRLPPRFNFRFMPDHGRRYDLTRYRKIFKNKHMGLIPARIGFIILAHAAPDALFQLITLIYRPQHFYVVHVDSRNRAARNVLNEMILLNFPGKNNIRILPSERSFATQWSAYLATRAHLQCYEELLRMGIWDYALVMSGNDLPIRSMEDFAASLAPYRGYSFQRPFLSNDPKFEIWYTCDDHNYFLGPHDRSPHLPKAGSSWSLYSREFLEFFLSENRPPEMQQAHFYLMTQVVSDEHYLASMVDILPEFRSKVIKRGFHQLRAFYNKNIDDNCRRSDIMDRCGQGPPDLHPEDMNFILLSSNNFFFARKFKMEVEDPIRNNVLHYYRNDRYKELNTKHQFSDKIVKSIAELLVSRHIDGGGVIQSVTGVRDWRVVPAYTGNPCCTQQWTARLVLPFRLFIDFEAVNERGETVSVRASFLSKTDVACFSSGNLRSLAATTRLPVNPIPETPDSNPNLHSSPIPTQPLHGRMHVFTWYDRENDEKHCLDNQLVFHTDTFGKPAKSAFYTIPMEPLDKRKSLHIEVTDDAGRHVCQHDFESPQDQGSLDRETNFTFMHIQFPCDNLHAGWNTITLTEAAKVDAYAYKIRLYFADDSSAESYETDVLPVLSELWGFEDAVVWTDDFGDEYYRYAKILNTT